MGTPRRTGRDEEALGPRRRRPARAAATGLALIAAVLLSPGGAAAESWRPATASRASPITYAAPDGSVAMTIRCARNRGYVEQVVILRGPLDLTPSSRGDGRMVDLEIAYRSVPGPDGLTRGGMTSGELATVTPRDGGHDLVAMTTANSLPNLATGEARPPTFRLSVGDRSFEIPFLPADLAARLERECHFRWYDDVIGGVLSLFYTGR